jgi:hypothetical protein
MNEGSDTRGVTNGAEAGDRPPYASAVLAALLAWLLYAITLAPTTAFWDTSEYIATAHIVGIPHPPGNPLFVVLAKVWTLLLAPLGLSVAVRVNLLAATTSAAATGFLYLIAHRVLLGIRHEGGFARVGAAAAAIIGATAFTVWNQSNVNEKVYTVSMAIIAAVSWLGVLWHDRKREPGSARYLLWAVFLLAIGSTNHPMSLLPAPALALLVITSGARPLLSVPVLFRAALLIVVGLSFNFVLPIRASLDPRINEGEPTCESFVTAAVSIYERALPGPTRGIASALPRCQALSDNLARVQYQTPPVTERKAPFSAQLEMYWQYFDWQWSRGLDPSELPSPARLPITLLFLALGAAGLAAAWRSDRAIFTYLVTLVGTLTIGLVVYLNFKYGYSLSPEVTNGDLHEVRERDYFYTAGFLLWGCLAGIGLAVLWHTLARMAGTARGYAIAAPILLLALTPLVLNWRWASRADDYAARDWAYDLLMSVEPYGILFTNGDNDTFPLWYIQEVEGVRQDVTVIVGQYLLTDWYPLQLQRHTSPGRQRLFDVAQAPGLYDDRPPPTSAITRMEPAALSQIQSARLGEDMTVPFPALAVTYPEGTVLGRGHLLALRIIHDSIAERPIYFVAEGGMLSELGLRPWGIRHGLVTKLDPRGPAAMAREGLVQGSEPYGGTWFELDRSLHLWDEIYLYRGLRDRAIWQDRASDNIPAQYYAAALLMADAAEVAGTEAAVVTRLRADALAFQVVADGGTALVTIPPQS